jgi:hypothetical protein
MLVQYIRQSDGPELGCVCSEPGVHGVFLKTSAKERRKSSVSERRQRRIVAAWNGQEEGRRTQAASRASPTYQHTPCTSRVVMSCAVLIWVSLVLQFSRTSLLQTNLTRLPTCGTRRPCRPRPVPLVRARARVRVVVAPWEADKVIHCQCCNST